MPILLAPCDLMKIALVHDFLVQHGGAEEVVKAFHDIWPEAPIYTLVHDPKKLGSILSTAQIRPSFIQQLPFGTWKYQWFLPFMPAAIEHHDLMRYDVVLSSSSAFAKGVITGPSTLHICYCHTPTRYLWTDTHRYMGERGMLWPFRTLGSLLLSYLRLWDRHSADRVDHFIANSNNVQTRIAKYYKRDSDVLHPPVTTDRFSIGAPGNYFLAGGRLVAYKRFDLVVKTFNRLGIQLKIFGTGPALAALRKAAKQNIQFIGFVNAEEKAALYRHCIAFIHPQDEDFGITAIEAMASGRPVIAYARGGALETVREGETGTFFDEQIWEALADTVLRFDPDAYHPQTIRQHALQWDIQHFKQRIKEYVEKKWEAFHENTKAQ